MQLTWYGHSCFRLALKGKQISDQAGVSSEDVTLVLDPFDKSVGLNPPRFKADVVLVSHNHSDHNYIEPFKDALIISEPGEYDFKDISIRGIRAYHDAKEGKDRGVVVMFKIEAEGLSVAHLGDLGQPKLTESQIDELGEVDVLLIPVGGKYTIDGDEAQEIIGQIEPRFVVPMHYKTPGLKVDVEGVTPFLKVMGASSLKPADKFSLKAKELISGETKIVLLEVGG